MGKDLSTKINENIINDEKTISDLIFKLLHTLAHLHSKNIFHRDIKPENIYFRSNGLADICLNNFYFADNYSIYDNIAY